MAGICAFSTLFRLNISIIIAPHFEKARKTFSTVTDCGKICLFIVVSYFLLREQALTKDELLTLEMQAGGAAHGIYGKEKALGAFTG